MAATDYAVNDPLAVKVWSKAIAREALKQTYIGKFIDQGDSALIQEKVELKKSAGDKITIGLRMQLTGDGVTEGETQEGNEEALTTYSDAVLINELGHAVRSRSRVSRQRVPFNVRAEARDGLGDWFSDRLDVSFFNQICGNTAETRLKFSGLNSTIAPDANHRLFANSGTNTTDQAVNGDNTAIMTLAYIDKAVALAKTSTPMIRPIKINGESKWVMFLHPWQVYSLRTNTNSGQWLDIQKAAMTGGQVSKNPIYTGALGEYNGVILHESVRVTNGVHSTSGAAQTSTRRAVLCGAQAGVIAFGQGMGFNKWEWVEDDFDYEREFGVSAMTIVGVKKLQFNSADFSTIVVTTYAVQPT